MTSLVALILGIMLLVPVPGLANVDNLTVQPTAAQSTIRILTLNVMQNSPDVERDVRFTGIVNYLKTHPRSMPWPCRNSQGVASINLPPPLTAAPTWPPSWLPAT